MVILPDAEIREGGAQVDGWVVVDGCVDGYEGVVACGVGECAEEADFAVEAAGFRMEG